MGDVEPFAPSRPTKLPGSVKATEFGVFVSMPARYPEPPLEWEMEYGPRYLGGWKPAPWNGAVDEAMPREKGRSQAWVATLGEGLELEPESKYVVRVRARGPGGWGPWSDRSHVIQTLPGSRALPAAAEGAAAGDAAPEPEPTAASGLLSAAGAAAQAAEPEPEPEPEPQSELDRLLRMGFQEQQCQKALETAADFEGAVAFLLANADQPAAFWAAAAEPEPEPEPEPAEEAEPPALDTWLAQADLAKYAPQIKEYGYDTLQVLKAATEADIVEMTEDADVKMKKPHRRLFLTVWRELLSAASQGGVAAAAGSPIAAGPPVAAQQLPEKYVAAQNQIRLGKPGAATHGLRVLMGVTDAQIGSFLQDHEAAIEREFAAGGSEKDKENLQRILAGTFRDDAGEIKTLDELMAHPSAQMAKLGRHHILALRLYTTDSYSKINDPLRKDPPERPHPFAATTLFISEGIKMLRAVAANLPDAHTPLIFWRGMRNLGLTAEFMAKGGTEFACVSTTASEAVAVHNFAASALPLVFRFVTKDFMTRGADISFLSVYPDEKESLYPPLTYLRAVEMKMETLSGVQLLVATVEPTMA